MADDTGADAHDARRSQDHQMVEQGCLRSSEVLGQLLERVAVDGQAAEDPESPFVAQRLGQFDQALGRGVRVGREMLLGDGHRHDDVVTERLCEARDVRSLADLQKALGIGFVSKVGNGDLGNPAFAFLTHSTSLTGRSASPINPRVFVFTNPKSKGRLSAPARPTKDFVAMAFVRGEPLVELASRDRETGELRFFLVRIDLANNAVTRTIDLDNSDSPVALAFSSGAKAQTASGVVRRGQSPASVSRIRGMQCPCCEV